MNNLETNPNIEVTSIDSPTSNTKKISILLIPFLVLFYLCSIFAAMYIGATYFSPRDSQDTKTIDLQNSDITKESPISTAQPTMIPSPSTTPDLTDWQTYTNETHGFSFKHPKNVEVTDIGTSPYNQYKFIYIGEKQRKSGKTQSSLSDGFMFNISVRGASTIEQEAEKTYNGAKQNCYEDSQLHRITDAKINGYDAKTYDVTNCMGDYTEHFISNNGNVFEITQLYVGDEPEYSEYKQTTAQMLSTFTFTK